MKSLAELQAIKEKMQGKVALREGSGEKRVVVGMGLPLLRMAAEQTGGTMEVESRHRDAHPDNHGTVVTAVFHTDHIDCPPVGDMTATVTTLIQGHPDTDFYFRHVCDGTEVELDTRALREILGEVSLAEFEVLQWITGYLTDQYNGQ